MTKKLMNTTQGYKDKIQKWIKWNIDDNDEYNLWSKYKKLSMIENLIISPKEYVNINAGKVIIVPFNREEENLRICGKCRKSVRLTPDEDKSRCPRCKNDSFT